MTQDSRQRHRLATHAAERAELASTPVDPPVVARMVVEIRSDGSRTIARGALEDTISGESVAIEARGATPLALARSLARAMISTPLLARHAVKALLTRRLRGRQ